MLPEGVLSIAIRADFWQPQKKTKEKRNWSNIDISVLSSTGWTYRYQKSCIQPFHSHFTVMQKRPKMCRFSSSSSSCLRHTFYFHAILICLYFTTSHFHTCTLQTMQPISLLILGSVFSDCVVLWGYTGWPEKNVPNFRMILCIRVCEMNQQKSMYAMSKHLRICLWIFT